MTDFMRNRNMEEDRHLWSFGSGWTALGCIDPTYCISVKILSKTGIYILL